MEPLLAAHERWCWGLGATCGTVWNLFQSRVGDSRGPAVGERRQCCQPDSVCYVDEQDNGHCDVDSQLVSDEDMALPTRLAGLWSAIGAALWGQMSISAISVREVVADAPEPPGGNSKKSK